MIYLFVALCQATMAYVAAGFLLSSQDKVDNAFGIFFLALGSLITGLLVVIMHILFDHKAAAAPSQGFGIPQEDKGLNTKRSEESEAKE